MATEHNIGSGVDRPGKRGLTDPMVDKVMHAIDPEPQKGKDDAARKRRVEQERNAFDLNHKPTERDAQIDGTGARFETDG